MESGGSFVMLQRFFTHAVILIHAHSPVPRRLFVGSFSFFGPVERVFRRVCYVLSVPLVVSFLFSIFYVWLVGKCGILGW